MMTQDDPAAHILVVDDDAGIRGVIRDYLEEHGYAVGTAASARELDAELARGKVDLIVLDVMMPGEDGLAVCRRLSAQPGPAIIMLSALGEDADRIIGLELGADDYLPKPCYPRELVARLRAVLRRVQADTPPDDERSERRIGPLVIAPARRESAIGERALDLTATEFDLLDQLSRRPGEVVTKDELSERALHRPREPYDRSVDVHISNLRQKLAAAGGGLEIETVRAIGYRLRTPE